MVTKKTNAQTDIGESQDVNEVELLRNEMASLKEMMAAILSAQQSPSVPQPPVEPILQDEEIDDVEVSPTKLVTIMSMKNGGLNLRGTRPIPIYLRDFGSTTRVTFDELRTICDNHYGLARNGGFLIQDKQAVKALYLEDDYKKLEKVNRKTVESFIDLPIDQLIPTLESLPAVIQETIIEKVVHSIFSGDNRYTDLNKLKVLNDYTGKDLMKIAQQLND